MEVMRRITSVLAAIILVLLLSSFMPLPVWADRHPNIMWHYRITFIGMFALNLAFRLLSSWYLRTKTHRSGVGEWLLMLYIVVFLGLSLWITVADFATLGRYFVLLVTLFTLFGLFFVPPFHTASTISARSTI